MMKHIEKSKVLAAIIAEVEHELSVAIQAAKTAAEDATGEESRPENEYDTRALEASYVARGQAQRVAELKEVLHDLKLVPARPYDSNSPVGIASLVELNHNSKSFLAFVMPKGGGFNVTVDGIRIQIVTPNTPLGEALLGASVGEDLLVEVGGVEKEFEVLSQQ